MKKLLRWWEAVPENQKAMSILLVCVWLVVAAQYLVNVVLWPVK